MSVEAEVLEFGLLCLKGLGLIVALLRGFRACEGFKWLFFIGFRVCEGCSWLHGVLGFGVSGLRFPCVMLPLASNRDDSFFFGYLVCDYRILATTNSG